jgi:hypothetical protein
MAVNGITLQGAGKSTAGTVITSDNAFAITKHATQVSRVSGFRFTSGGQHGSVSGAASARAFVIDNCYFFSSGGGDVPFVRLSVNGGLLHHNDFFMNPSTAGGPDTFPIHAGETWSQATTMGTADTQGPSGGERNLYFEDNTFSNILETAPDGDVGVRLVLRHNHYIDSSIVFHSGGNGVVNDTSLDGTRQFEIYNNTFSRVNATGDNVNKWVWVRGGSGVIANNVMDIVETPEWSNKMQILLSIGTCPSYPVKYQIGQTNVPAQSPPPQPLLIFGNTGAGATHDDFIRISGENGGGMTCGNPNSFIQAGRDYMTSNTWGWAPFKYPHPLSDSTGGGTGTGPAPPTAVQAVAR